MGIDDCKVYKAFFIRELFTDVGGIGISDGLGERYTHPDGIHMVILVSRKVLQWVHLSF